MATPKPAVRPQVMLLRLTVLALVLINAVLTETLALAQTALASPTPVWTNTPPSSGPYVSVEVNPTSLNVGGTALVNIRLNNVPVEGYKSAEFACTYNATLVQVSNIAVTGLFGPDAMVAIYDPRCHGYCRGPEQRWRHRFSGPGTPG